jgi:hypothetical protein
MAAENILVIDTSSTKPDRAIRNIPANSNLRFTKIGTDCQLAIALLLSSCFFFVLKML